MEINQERLEEIKAELAERHQMPLEEVSIMIDNVMGGFTEMAGWLFQIWSSIKDEFQEYREKTLWHSENEAVHGWHIDWDTRKRSQVMSNKPKFWVRKIIY